MDFMPDLGEERKEKAQEWEQYYKFFRHSFAPDCPIAFFNYFIGISCQNLLVFVRSPGPLFTLLCLSTLLVRLS